MHRDASKYWRHDLVTAKDQGGDPVEDPVVDPVEDPVVDPVVDPAHHTGSKHAGRRVRWTHPFYLRAFVLYPHPL
jgi:hypothetical protein